MIVLWNRSAQNVVMHSGKALLFKDSAAADVWLARNATVRKSEKSVQTFDKLTVL